MQHEKGLSRVLERRFICFGLIIFSVAAAAGFVGAAVYFNRTAVDEAQASAAAAHSEYQRALSAYQAKLKQARDIEAEAKQRPATDVVRYSDNCTPVDDPAAITVIVSKTRCFNPKNWQPQDLVSIGDNERMRAEAAKHYTEMKQAANTAGKPFAPSSAYRSHDEQITVYNHWVATNKNAAAADLVSARPGYSEHQTGLAVDLKVGSCALECFATTPAYAWLRGNGARYGFIQRYPEKMASVTGYDIETWHWRYIGVENALAMKRLGFETLEAYMKFVESK